jgi:FecR protein
MIHPSALKHFSVPLLLVAMVCAFPGLVLAAAATAQFSVGDVRLSQGEGAGRALVKGGVVESGETITTGSQGRVQLRFSDGGMIALPGNSRFSVNGYVDAGDKTQDKFLVTLVQGGMRAITGLIGKRERSNYKVITNTATIGIRGSGFNVAYNPNGTLSVSTELDAIEVCNAGGCVGLNVGESALVRNAQDRPVRTNIPATVAGPAVTRQPFEVGNEAENNGVPTLIARAIPPAAAPATSYALGLSGLRGATGTADLRQYFDGAIAQDANGQIVGYTDKGTGDSVQNTGEVANLQRAGSAASNDLLVLGTWSSATVSPGAASTNPAMALSPAAFFAGQRSADADLAGLSGRSATYRFDQATPVLSSRGGQGTLLPTSQLTANFSGGNTTVGVNLDVRFPGKGEYASTDYALRGNVGKVDAGFAGNLAVTGGGCTAGKCDAIASGAFIGPAAARAGVSFAASTSQHGNFAGAGGFARGALTGAMPQPQPQPGLATPGK